MVISFDTVPVVPHKAAAEVSGFVVANHRWQNEATDGSIQIYLSIYLSWLVSEFVCLLVT